MKLLANENFPLKSVLYLRSKGYDIISIGTDTPGIQDDVVMTIAMKEERTILTFDRTTVNLFSNITTSLRRESFI